jgi:tRNA-dihydrouridine synthase B
MRKAWLCLNINKKTVAMLKYAEKERPLAIQIFGNEPEIMAEAASIVEALSPDMIDINMGCPARKVCGSESGAFLLRDPLLINKITSAVVKNVNIPVSAKIRTGWDDDSKNYRDVVKALEDGGISMITVHGRTRLQQYSGYADWEIIEEIASISSVPVIGNGDIKSYNQGIELLQKSGCSAVMIGRGAIGNPWIFRGHTPSIQEIKDQIKEHLFMMIDEYGEFGIKLMRKHIVKYIHGIRNAAALRSRILQSMDIDEIISTLDMLDETV